MLKVDSLYNDDIIGIQFEFIDVDEPEEEVKIKILEELKKSLDELKINNNEIIKNIVPVIRF